jgi:phosphate:Na+ symporter
MQIETIIGILGGTALLMYGINMVSLNFQIITSKRLRTLVDQFAGGKYKSFLIGFFLTALLQSSGATTVVLVGFTSAALIGLYDAISFIIGANIGTTIAAQIIAFHVYDFAPLVFFLTLLVYLFAFKTKHRVIISIVLGFSLIFFGLYVVSTTVSAAAGDEVFPLLKRFSDNYFLLFLLAIVFTALVQSSLVTIGITMVLAHLGYLNLISAMPIIFGANIGTCAVIFFAYVSLRDRRVLQVAISHLLFNIIGVILIFPLMDYFSVFVAKFSHIFAFRIDRQIATAHLLFNVLVAIPFFLFLKPFSQFISFLIPLKRFHYLSLSDALVLTPQMALSTLHKQIIHLLNITIEVVKESKGAMLKEGFDEQKILKGINYVENSVPEVISFSSKMFQKSLTEAESLEMTMLVSTANELGHIVQLTEKRLLEIIRKDVYFSSEKSKDIALLHERILNNFSLVKRAFVENSRSLALTAFNERLSIREFERLLKKKYFQKVYLGEDVNMMSSYLDVLDVYVRLNVLVGHIARILLGQVF